MTAAPGRRRAPPSTTRRNRFARPSRRRRGPITCRSSPCPCDLAGEPVSRRMRSARSRCNGRRAQGIAQFMPGTAAEWNLPADRFDPISGAAEVGGNPCAYCVGVWQPWARWPPPTMLVPRIHDWLAGQGRRCHTRPATTCMAITGKPVEQWSKAGSEDGQQASRRPRLRHAGGVAQARAEPVLHGAASSASCWAP